MVTLNRQERQLLEAINTLPPQRRRLVLYELAKETEEAWQRNTAYAKAQLRRLAAERGLDWDALSDQQRQDFVCELVHEDR